MEYKFIKHEAVNSKSEARITVTRSNSIGFPTTFYQDNHVKDFKYVVLYFDQTNQAIGIKFTNDAQEKGKFSIIHSKNYGGGVAALSFFKNNRIDTALVSGKYEWKKLNLSELGFDESAQLYVINLKEKGN